MIYLNMIRLTDYEIQNPVLLEPQVYKFSLPTMLKCFRMHRADFKKIGMSLQNFQHVACFSCMFWCAASILSQKISGIDM